MDVARLEQIRNELDSTVARLGVKRADVVALIDHHKREHGLPITAETYVEHVQGAGVPGGHLLIGKVLPNGARRPPWKPSVREIRSIALRHTDVVVDIGAYVGTYALTAARFPVRKVVAYEPTPSTFEILSSQTRPPNLEIVQAAVVADNSETAQLFISSGVGASNRIVSDGRGSSVTVSAISYAEAVAEATVVKIDVEGAEYDYPIVQPSLRAVIIDFHKVGGRPWQKDAERIVEQLHDNGFQPVINPRLDAGLWGQAGSWVREIEEPDAVYEPMLQGRECCGCGSPIHTQGKGLCRACWKAWNPSHRVGYVGDTL